MTATKDTHLLFYVFARGVLDTSNGQINADPLPTRTACTATQLAVQVSSWPPRSGSEHRSNSFLFVE
jgi:hypothetical protein